MGNSESSSSGANNNQQEKEEEGRGVSLGDVGKAAAVAAAGIAALAIGAHQIRSSLPSQREEEGFDVSSGRDVHWEPPPYGCLKINTDFSADSGVGYVIRDHGGNMLFAEGKRTSGQTNRSSYGEANAILHTLDAALRLKLQDRRLILESDNESIVKLLTMDASPGRRMTPVVQDILEKMELFEEIKVRHAKRGANRVANHLAKEAAKGRPWCLDSSQIPPVDLRRLLKEDCEAGRLGNPY